MASAHDGAPSRTEVEKELERLLASKRFKAAPNQARMLRYVVRQRLQDAELSEAVIGHALFPHWIEEFPLRRCARNRPQSPQHARALLRGRRNDRSHRDHPPPRPENTGRCFPSILRRQKPYERGLHLYSSLAARGRCAGRAIEQFDKAIALDAAHAPAFAAKAEVEFSRAFFWQWPFPKEAVAACGSLGERGVAAEARHSGNPMSSWESRTAHVANGTRPRSHLKLR